MVKKKRLRPCKALSTLSTVMSMGSWTACMMQSLPMLLPMLPSLLKATLPTLHCKLLSTLLLLLRMLLMPLKTLPLQLLSPTRTRRSRPMLTLTPLSLLQALKPMLRFRRTLTLPLLRFRLTLMLPLLPRTIPTPHCRPTLMLPLLLRKHQMLRKTLPPQKQLLKLMERSQTMLPLTLLNLLQALRKMPCCLD